MMPSREQTPDQHHLTNQNQQAQQHLQWDGWLKEGFAGTGYSTFPNTQGQAKSKDTVLLEAEVASLKKRNLDLSTKVLYLEHRNSMMKTELKEWKKKCGDEKHPFKQKTKSVDDVVLYQTQLEKGLEDIKKLYQDPRASVKGHTVRFSEDSEKAFVRRHSSDLSAQGRQLEMYNEVQTPQRRSKKMSAKDEKLHFVSEEMFAKNTSQEVSKLKKSMDELKMNFDVMKKKNEELKALMEERRLLTSKVEAINRSQERRIKQLEEDQAYLLVSHRNREWIKDRIHNSVVENLKQENTDSLRSQESIFKDALDKMQAETEAVIQGLREESRDKSELFKMALEFAQAVQATNMQITACVAAHNPGIFKRIENRPPGMLAALDNQTIRDGGNQTANENKEVQANTPPEELLIVDLETGRDATSADVRGKSHDLDLSKHIVNTSSETTTLPNKDADLSEASLQTEMKKIR